MGPARKRARSKSRLRTSQQALVPENFLQTPGDAKSADKRGFAWGNHVHTQRGVMAVLAVHNGKHASSEIGEFISSVDPSIGCSDTMIRKVCKIVALTGVLVPFIEALPHGRFRYMYFVSWAPPSVDEWDHLLTIEEYNSRVDEGACTSPWVG